MIMKKQDLLSDKSFQKYVQKKNISTRTLDSYMYALKEFCNANQKTLDEIITETLEEQYPYIDEYGRIIEYNPNYANIDNYLQETITYLKRKGNTNNSIQSIITRIRVVLSSLGVKLPDKTEMPNDTKEWYALSKDDIRYVNSISTLHHQALFTFISHTGIRTADIINFKIKDFMKATYKYHECTELDEFLEKAPDDMIGYWEFKPRKTLRHNIKCKVYNTQESSNLILKSLHARKKSIENRNKKYGKNDRLEKNDALFSSRMKDYKGHFNKNTLAVICNRKNDRLREHHIRQLKQQLKEGNISEETYNAKIEQIPRFHPHGLRKFFITTLARKHVDLRASAYLEGHKPLMKHDHSYVDSGNLEDLIFEEYSRVIPALSFLKDEEDFELGQRNHDLQIENTQLKQKNQELLDENKNIKLDFEKEARKVFEDILRENNIKL